ncbi:hypothetical protein GCM10022226_07020 [Sphaerisporangium flaviroseum]|uniref:Uncharacterized protein n=1 Tax=Sphaerisporangium flaviroseum TaxID=509199 RepID=A0ABP7HHG5_9ACTN
MRTARWATISVSGPSCTQYSGASTAKIGEKCSPSWMKSMPWPIVTPRSGLVGAPNEAKPRTAWSKSVRSRLVARYRSNLTRPSSAETPVEARTMAVTAITCRVRVEGLSAAVTTSRARPGTATRNSAAPTP